MMTIGRPIRLPQRICLASLMLMGWLILASPDASANDKGTSGTSSKQAKNQAIGRIPFDRLTPEAKAKISDALRKPSVYRRLPVSTITADPDYFQFLVRRPEVIVEIWDLMGVTKMTTQRTGPYTIQTNDGAGTISNLELIYGTQDLHIFYGTGTYEGPILKRKLTGNCVLLLQSQTSLDRNQQPIVTSQLDVFLKIENATAGLVAKTVAPIVGSTADHNFVESMKFVQRLNQTTQRNGPGVKRMGRKLKIDPEVLQEYERTVDLVYQRSISQENQNLNSAAITPTPTSPTQSTFVPASYQRQSIQEPGYRQPDIQSREPQQSPGLFKPGFFKSGFSKSGLTQPVQTRFQDQPSTSTTQTLPYPTGNYQGVQRQQVYPNFRTPYYVTPVEGVSQTIPNQQPAAWSAGRNSPAKRYR
ncbi:MAG: hypothetical protein AAF623_12590 [Planctomycetota bacterium]